MTLLTAENLCKRHKDQIILEQVSFTIRSGERIALVGKNGIGKTTLLEIMAGKQSADSGTVSRPRDCVIDYIEQEKSDYLDMTLFDFVADARAELIRDAARDRRRWSTISRRTRPTRASSERLGHASARL